MTFHGTDTTYPLSAPRTARIAGLPYSQLPAGIRAFLLRPEAWAGRTPPIEIRPSPAPGQSVARPARGAPRAPAVAPAPRSTSATSDTRARLTGEERAGYDRMIAKLANGGGAQASPARTSPATAPPPGTSIATYAAAQRQVSQLAAEDEQRRAVELLAAKRSALAAVRAHGSDSPEATASRRQVAQLEASSPAWTSRRPRAAAGDETIVCDHCGETFNTKDAAKSAETDRWICPHCNRATGSPGS